MENQSKKFEGLEMEMEEESKRTLRRSFNGTPTAKQTSRIESRATRVR